MNKRLYGEGHPEVVWVTKQLARFHLRGKKNLGEALRLFEELLAAQRKLLGNENRQVARTLADLAATHIDNGKLVEGERLARESLALHKRLYGEENPEVAMTSHDLGIALWRVGKIDEAETLLREAISVSRKFLPPDSNRLALSLKNLAQNLESQKKLAEAEIPFRERFETARQKPNHDPDSLETRLYDLAHNVYSQKKYAQAELLYRELIQRRSSRRPVAPEDVINAKASLARLLADWAWAERSNTVAADVRRLTSKSEVRGAKAASDQSLVSPAATPIDRAREGEQLLRECLALRLQGTNAGHWRVSDVRSRLGGAMLSVAVTDRALTDEARQSRFSEIETLLLEGHKGIMTHKSPGRTRKRGAFERLVWLYEAWNKPAQAADWREKLAEFDKSKDTEESSPPADAEPAP